MEDCIFCKIGRREIPSQIIYEDEEIFAFKDINPAAPVHVLIVPKQHIQGVLSLETPELAGKIILVGKMLAKELSIAEDGFRIVVNSGEYAGQSVAHIHFHLLGGRPMNWPPG